MFTQLKYKLFGKWMNVHVCKGSMKFNIATSSDLVVEREGTLTIQKNSKTGKYRAYFIQVDGTKHTLNPDWARMKVGIYDKENNN